MVLDSGYVPMLWLLMDYSPLWYFNSPLLSSEIGSLPQRQDAYGASILALAPGTCTIPQEFLQMNDEW